MTGTGMRAVKSLLVFQLLFYHFSSIAQSGGTKPDPGMISGTSSNFGINDAFNASLFSGSLNVNIPFYTFSHEDRSFQVTLGYNTKGILVDEINNSPGLHWDLNSGPSIQRVVKDIPDELILDTQEDSLYMGSVAFYNKDRYIRGRLATYWETPAQQAQTNVYRDGESDEFIVNLGGSKFSFYLGKGLKAFTHPHRNVQIRLQLDGTPIFSVTTPGMANDPFSRVLTFEITDEQGVVYLFEQGDLQSQTHYNNNYWDNQIIGGSRPIVSWNIKRITFADGKKIEYNYHHSWDPGIANAQYVRYINHSVWETSSGLARYLGYSSDVTDELKSQVKNITYPNGSTVVFSYDNNVLMEDGRMQLREIAVKSTKENQNCVRYRFFQSKNAERWYLDSIRMYSCDNSYSERYYAFGYNSVRLPRRLNPGQDLFGYYNGDSTAVPAPGNNDNKINIPKHHFSAGGSLNYGLNKNYFAYYAQASLLNRIKNAFGAEVRFVFKNNSSDVASPFTIPGGTGNENFVGVGTLGMDGVAIDSIIQTDIYHLNERLITKFDYHNSGMLFTPGGYIHYPKYINSVSGSWDTIVYQGLYLSAHQFVNGSNHGYSKVGIRKYNGAGQLLSRVEQTFTNISDELSASRFYRVPGSSQLHEYPYSNKQYIKDWEIGLPLATEIYDNNNKIVEKTINEYSFSGVDLSAVDYLGNTKISKVNSGAKVLIPGAGAGNGYFPNKIQFLDNYYPYTGSAFLTKVTSQKFTTDTRYVNDESLYNYDDHNNITRVVNTNSKGEKIMTTAIYNYMVDGPNSPNGTANPTTPLYYMSNAGLEKLISMERWKLAPAVLDQPYENQLLDAFVIGYEFTEGRARKKKLFNSVFSAPVSYTSYTGISMGGTMQSPYGKVLQTYNSQYPGNIFLKTSEVTLFDNYNNPLEQRFTNDGRYTASIYDTSTHALLASAENAKYNEIAYTSFEDVDNIGYYLVRGNLDFNTAKILDLNSSSSLSGITGRYIYSLTPNVSHTFNISDIVGKQELTAGKDYVLSLWCLGGVPNVALGINNIAAPTQPAVQWNGWKNYLYHFHVDAPARIIISNSGTVPISLDEIRLCPADASMQSFTCQPLFGTSTATDSRGHIFRYEYDKLGRLKLVRDQVMNILKKIETGVNGGI